VTVSAVRTVERGYVASTGRRAGQVRRVHVIREEGPRGWDNSEFGNQTLCGQGAWKGQNSPPIIRYAPHELPEGLTWCPKCVGQLAELLGRTHAVARLLGLEAAGG
jgi:hypothetical protein